MEFCGFDYSSLGYDIGPGIATDKFNCRLLGDDPYNISYDKKLLC